MSLKLASSGSYNVHASETAPGQTDRQARTVNCVVHFLDQTDELFEVDKRQKAQLLLDKVYDHLELVEKDYFGLQFIDMSSGEDGLRWLDPLKVIRKQCRGPPYEFFFCVKFYVSDPSKLIEEYTRFHFFLQVRQDLLLRRLVCSAEQAASLASYVAQSELGDFNPVEHKDGYLHEFLFVPNQTRQFEQLVAEKHQHHRGQTPADAEYNFLEEAKHLEMYGVELHNAVDESSMEIQLGVTSTGFVVFQNSMKINTFLWSKIVKISFKRKQFYIQLRSDVCDSMQFLQPGTFRPQYDVENAIAFNMVSYRSCKNLWKSCVEHHTFFRLHHPNPPAKKMFSMGSKFRYSGRTEFQTLEESKRRVKMDRPFSRSPSKRCRRTLGAVSREAVLDGNRFMDAYQQMSKSQTFSGQLEDAQYGFEYCKRDFTHGRSRGTLPFDYKVEHVVWNGSANAGKSDEDVRSLTHPVVLEAHPQPTPTVVNCSKGDNNEQGESQQEFYCNDYAPNGNCSIGEGHGLVTIRMKPDSNGRFGFNVKGGVDQGMPIIVSRVAPDTPADLSNPRLNEGDQVMFINGRDVSQHTHEQVVMFIKASRETHSGVLMLTVRPNVYVGDGIGEEPEFSYVPETHQIASSASDANTLGPSLLLLQEALESGAAIAQFEQLYRKKPGFTVNVAKMDKNVDKNRYRDISPYDQTRVVLRSCVNGDYINASHVNMEIPGPGIINRYIASQGPLPNTSIDFWQMVWEQQSTLIVMLTTMVERGRVKCHRYWPQLYETEDMGALHVTCVKEEESPSFAFRDFSLTDVDSRADRHVRHVQYIAWPDHGVPDDPADFLDFVVKVRRSRVGTVGPVVVHCSAGIGRTGVLITMETAMCLVEANQPIFPLTIVRQMRDQRAMLIQTSSQYKFVCEAILRAYNEGLVRPVEDRYMG